MWNYIRTFAFGSRTVVSLAEGICVMLSGKRKVRATQSTILFNWELSVTAE